MHLHYKTQENETIQLGYDRSLYQYICKYFKFPVGLPIIHVGDASKDMKTCLRMDGLIKCSIFPPQGLNHPVLPSRCNNKLMSGCRMCAHTSSSSEACGHTEDEDRALTGTWLMDGLSLAVEKRYRVLEIYEVHEYEVTQYNPDTGECGLFLEYINKFLKLKVEDSGLSRLGPQSRRREEVCGIVLAE